MSGDWIKIEHALITKPEVMAIAAELGINEYEVVGHLVAFWSWVDQNMSPDCPSVMGTKSGLDRVVGRDGFVDAMVRVGWLQFDGNRVNVPNYNHHLSQSAKKRATDARKKRVQRSRSDEHRGNCPPVNGTSTGKRQGTRTGQNGGPEKRIEEKSETAMHEVDDGLVTSLQEIGITNPEEHFRAALNNGKSATDVRDLIAEYKRRQSQENPPRPPLLACWLKGTKPWPSTKPPLRESYHHVKQPMEVPR